MDLLGQIEEKLGAAKACFFKTGKQIKRRCGTHDIRYTWKLYDANNKIMAESEWDGFESLTTAMEDMLKHIV